MELWESSKLILVKIFIIGVNEGIVFCNGVLSLLVFVYGVWLKGFIFKYDLVCVVDGYVFLGGFDLNGIRIYIFVGLNDGNLLNIWGIGY